MKGVIALAGLAAVALAGCQTPQEARTEGVSYAVGDAVAANTVIQMVDPWPWGVHRTDLAVPADPDQYKPAGTAEEEGVASTSAAGATTAQ